MPGTKRTLIQIGALLCALLMLALALPGASATRRGRVIVQGVSFRSYRLYKPLNRVRVVTFDPASAPTLDVVLANDKLPGLETTSSMAARSGAVAAINGDYAQPSGRPVFTFARDGALDQTPRRDSFGNFMYGRNFSMDRSESQAYFDNPKTRAYAYESDTGTSYPVTRVNDGPVALDELVQFTHAGGSVASPPPDACSARLRPVQEPQPTTAPRKPATYRNVAVAVEIEYYVDVVRCRHRALKPYGGVVLSAPLGGSFDPVIRALLPGERMVLGWTLGWTDVFDSIGGNPTLIEDGLIQYQSMDADDGYFANARLPRTAVAWDSETHQVFLLTVDGRQPGYSNGMSLQQLAVFLKTRLGATDALNLDGGGSTTMVLCRRIGTCSVKGRPSDAAGERPVSSALVILPGADPGETFGPYPPPPPVPSEPPPTASPTPSSPTPTPSAGTAATPGAIAPVDVSRVYARMVEDPGSIGGLSLYLQGRARHVPEFMRRAAREFWDR